MSKEIINIKFDNFKPSATIEEYLDINAGQYSFVKEHMRFNISIEVLDENNDEILNKRFKGYGPYPYKSKIEINRITPELEWFMIEEIRSLINKRLFVRVCKTIEKEMKKVCKKAKVKTLGDWSYLYNEETLAAKIRKGTVIDIEELPKKYQKKAIKLILENKKMHKELEVGKNVCKVDIIAGYKWVDSGVLEKEEYCDVINRKYGGNKDLFNKKEINFLVEKNLISSKSNFREDLTKNQILRDIENELSSVDTLGQVTDMFKAFISMLTPKELDWEEKYAKAKEDWAETNAKEEKERKIVELKEFAAFEIKKPFFKKEEEIVEVIETNSKEEEIVEVIETNSKEEEIVEVIETNKKEEEIVEVIETNKKEEEVVEVIETNKKEEEIVEVIETNKKEEENWVNIFFISIVVIIVYLEIGMFQVGFTEYYNTFGLDDIMILSIIIAAIIALMIDEPKKIETKSNREEENNSYSGTKWIRSGYNFLGEQIEADMAQKIDNKIYDRSDPSSYNEKLKVNREQLINMINNNEDVTNLDTSNITDMSGITRDNLSFNQDISGWDVSKVSNMDYMFWVCQDFNQDLSKWDTSKVRNMSYMFVGCKKFNQDLSEWNTTKVTTFLNMFYKCNVYNQDMSKWDVSKVENMEAMFYECKSFNQELWKWDTSSVTNMQNMFYNCEKLNKDISGWDVSKVITKKNMFNGSSIKDILQPVFKIEI